MFQLRLKLPDSYFANIHAEAGSYEYSSPSYTRGKIAKNISQLICFVLRFLLILCMTEVIRTK